MPRSVHLYLVAVTKGNVIMNERTLLIGFLAGAIVATVTGVAVSLGNSEAATAQMSGGHAMDSGNMGGMTGGASMGGGQMMQHYPCMISEQCGGSMGGMPPHYCEPVYKTMSSVKGIRVSNVDLMDDNSLMVTLQQISSMAEATNERIIVVGGGGDLAGGIVVDAGWDGTTTVHLNLTGTGSIYDRHDGLSIHLFPYTG